MVVTGEEAPRNAIRGDWDLPETAKSSGEQLVLKEAGQIRGGGESMHTDFS
jgi:hypothetical protein